jgi:hypothetical protein
MVVIFFVSSDVLKDERARGGYEEDLEHEIVQSFKIDLAEAFRLQWFTIVVSKEFSPGREGISLDTHFHIDFKLVTDAFDTCTPKNPDQY